MMRLSAKWLNLPWLVPKEIYSNAENKTEVEKINLCFELDPQP